MVIPSKSDFCFFVEPFLGGISPKKRRVSSLVATLHEEETALYLDARQPLFVVKYTKYMLEVAVACCVEDPQGQNPFAWKLCMCSSTLCTLRCACIYSRRGRLIWQGSRTCYRMLKGRWEAEFTRFLWLLLVYVAGSQRNLKQMCILARDLLCQACMW